jgi:hypothetical protein
MAMSASKHIPRTLPKEWVIVSTTGLCLDKEALVGKEMKGLKSLWVWLERLSGFAAIRKASLEEKMSSLILSLWGWRYQQNTPVLIPGAWWNCGIQTPWEGQGWIGRFDDSIFGTKNFCAFFETEERKF